MLPHIACQHSLNVLLPSHLQLPGLDVVGSSKLLHSLQQAAHQTESFGHHHCCCGCKSTAGALQVFCMRCQYLQPKCNGDGDQLHCAHQQEGTVRVQHAMHLGHQIIRGCRAGCCWRLTRQLGQTYGGLGVAFHSSKAVRPHAVCLSCKLAQPGGYGCHCRAKSSRETAGRFWGTVRHPVRG